MEDNVVLEFVHQVAPVMDFGEVLVVGNQPSLGDWNVTYALKMNADEATSKLCCRISIPRKNLKDLEYKYVLREREIGSVEWWPRGPNLKLDSELVELETNDEDMLILDDTIRKVHFRMEMNLPFHEDLCVCGSIEELGEWAVSRALRMSHSDRDHWIGSMEIPNRRVMSYDAFEFKYVIVLAETKERVCYESRINRRILLKSEFESKISLHQDLYLHHTWNGLTVQLVMFHPLPKGYRLGVIGSNPSLGDWKQAVPMKLGQERTTLTNQRERCWELCFRVSQNEFPVDPFPYRYVQLNEARGSAIWEREPNRILTIPELESESCAHGVFEVFDGNFVTEMDIDKVYSESESWSISLGPYPQTREDVITIKELGVTAVLNLQTDHDFNQRQIDWDLLLDIYKELGIEVVRLPILDFDADSLEMNLHKAVEIMKKLVDENHHIYAHCNASMGRSPAVVIAYLAAYHGYQPVDALSKLREVRPKVGPNMQVIQKVIQKYY
eukprot:CAMPEP_0182451180 /NCGR_PEP_ID=MMETSP1172-20130603/43578_1 /TAXON_ID=708627 /ORGANISM="Timspurckia oligopyrenoides, Strain CCMP3278" /LENGTH=497 /DNA_ID=CAMNT_0024648929 /DNA_START=54 /DNA_END=1547 /DNA_ORIENTATION=-